MADAGASCAIENEEQLWTELSRVVTTHCPVGAYEAIDNALRSWLYLAARCRDEFSQSEDDVANCSQVLLNGSLFQANPEYVRTQIIYSLLQEDEPGPLYVIANFLLLDGRADEATFKRMIGEGCFHRLLELITGCREDDPGLHRLLLELMYEMSRIEPLRIEDLLHVDDGFVAYLFQLIEGLSDDAHDPYHYPVIRVLLVLNEQYMVASTATASEPTSPTAPLTNRVVKCLSLYGPHYRTFGENIILLLNRETETSLQLLILKLLYLLFTTKATYEYFYTNDLRVLLDVIIRNLLDLPNELMALRHTYLRVLYPLLAHTQLNQPPHYKKDEVQKLLRILAGSGNTHFAPVDETTIRLVDRVSKVKWLSDEGIGSGEIARKFLGISLSPTDAASNVSVVDVAAVMEKPGIQTPSRKIEVETEIQNGIPRPSSSEKLKDEAKEAPKPSRPKKPLPEVPKHRHGIPYASTGHENGTRSHSKKLPPKAPPPRRKGRLKHSTNSETVKSVSELV
ncbi:pre-rRNA processing [Parahypoxylon ruwenzoriense]